MDKCLPGRFFTNIPHVHALYSYRAHGNMKYTEYKDGEANRDFFRMNYLTPDSRIALAKVNHRNKVVVAEDCDLETIFETDALVAKGKENLYLGVTFADCPFLLLADPARSIVGAVHCGWKPIANDILRNVFNKMLHLGASIENIRAAIGPGICKKCYEFGEKDAKKYFKLYKNFVYQSKKPDKCQLDLRGIIIYQLVSELGIKLRNVEISNDCTSCNNDVYFSYRKEKMNPENIEAGIALIGIREV